MIKKLLYFILFYSSLSLFAQNENLRAVISKSEISIRKAQKEMISHHDNQQTENLSLAIKYQELAVKEWKAGRQNKAVCLSILAREYSNKILSYFQLKGIDFYLMSEDEKVSEKTCGCADKRMEYEKLISNIQIDSSLLTNPESLDNNYKISLD